MSEHHQILRANPASWNGAGLAGKPWINLEWAWQWFVYVANPHLNPYVALLTLFFFEVVMLAAFIWAMRAMAPELTAEARIGLYALYALLAFVATTKLRAELFSFAAFPLLLGIVWRSRSRPGWLWALSPLTGVWANVHGSWLIIPVLMLLETFQSVWSRHWRAAEKQAALGVGAPLAVAVALTPFHLSTLTYAWWLDHNHEINTYIQEWKSVNFHSDIYLLIAAAVLGAWLWRVRTRRRYPLLLDVWFIGITLAFFNEVRMITYFGMVFALWLGYGMVQSPRFQEWLPGQGGRRSLRWAQASGLGAALAACLLYSQATGGRWAAPLVPSGVVHWLNTHPHRVVLAPIDDGGYLEAHGVSGVFADGRSDFFLANGDRFQNYVSLVISQSARPAKVQQIFHAHHVDAILWPKAHVNTTLGWYIAAHHWHRVLVQGSWALYMPSR